METIELKDVAQRKLDAKLTRGASNAQTAVQRLLDEGKISRDFTAPIGTFMEGRPPIVTFDSNGVMYMNVKDEQFTMHPHSVGQVADKLAINRSYLSGLATGGTWEKSLAAHILNEHSLHTEERSRVLVRAVGSEVRGVLSDHYRRLNSPDIITSFIETAIENGAQVSDGWMDDTRMRFEVVLPNLLEVPTANNGMVHLIVGAVMTSSDYGDGALQMNAYLMQAICTNGMVRERALRAIHLGGRLPENIQMSERTYQLDTKTQSSAVRDITNVLFNRQSIMKRATEIQAASETLVDMDRELTNLSHRNLLTKSEIQTVSNVLMRNSADEDGVTGGSTLWKLTQGITAVARDVNDRRAHELQEIAGDLINRVNRK